MLRENRKRGQIIDVEEGEWREERRRRRMDEEKGSVRKE